VPDVFPELRCRVQLRGHDLRARPGVAVDARHRGWDDRALALRGEPRLGQRFFGDPCEGDPVVFVRVGSRTATPTRTASVVDTCAIAPGAVARDVRADALQTFLGFDVQDEDPAGSNEAIGNCAYTMGIPSNAFEGVTQTTNCAANCTTGSTPGWGPIHWHLER
jgi:hypothetical protein